MASPRHRQPRVSADHQNLAADVLEISNRVAAIDRHLSELRDLQARAIALAASRGVPQRVLAEIVGVTAPRISQIVQGNRSTSTATSCTTSGWPGRTVRPIKSTRCPAVPLMTSPAQRAFRPTSTNASGWNPTATRSDPPLRPAPQHAAAVKARSCARPVASTCLATPSRPTPVEVEIEPNPAPPCHQQTTPSIGTPTSQLTPWRSGDPHLGDCQR